MCPPGKRESAFRPLAADTAGYIKPFVRVPYDVSQRRPRPDWFAERFAWAVPVLPYVAHGCGVGLGRLPVVLPRCGLGEHPRDLAPCPCLVGDDLGVCWIATDTRRRVRALSVVSGAVCGRCRRRLALPLGLADKPSGDRPYSNCQVLVKGKFCLRRLGPAGRADRRCSWCGWQLPATPPFQFASQRIPQHRPAARAEFAGSTRLLTVWPCRSPAHQLAIADVLAR